MNFFAINQLLAQAQRNPKLRDYMQDATSETPTVGVHEKGLPHDLIPLSFKDMMRYAAPDYDAAPEPMQTMQVSTAGGYKPVTDLKIGIRPLYQQVY